MKYSYPLFIIAAFLFVSAFFACTKMNNNNSNNNPNQNGNNTSLTGTPVNGSVAGRIVDENDSPVVNADVIIDNTGFYTDNHGFFNTPTIALDKNYTIAAVIKEGFFTTIRTFCANATKNYIIIKLLPKGLPNVINSSSGGSVTLSNGTQIIIPANGIITQNNGVPYNGTVNVYAAYIDPTASDINITVPGNFTGTDTVFSQLYTTASMGMLAVQLESPSGQVLQLAPNNRAEIKLPILAPLRGIAPPSISTWLLTPDNVFGLWLKVGTATKTGNVYDFYTSYLSFLGCDTSFAPVRLTIHVQDQNNNPLMNSIVALDPSVAPSYGASYSISDSAGNASSMVPSDQSLNFSLYSSPFSCTGLLTNQSLGQFTQDATVNGVATLSPQQELTVTGTATNCGDTAFQNGSVAVYTNYNTVYYTSMVNGSFRAVIPYCPSITEIESVSIDNTSSQKSDTAIQAVTGNSVNIGLLKACGSYVDDYLLYSVDGTDTINTSNISDSLFISPFVTQYGDKLTSINFYDNIHQSYPGNYITFPGDTLGTFNVDGNCGFLWYTLYSYNLPSTGTVTYTVYGQHSGDYIEGTFNIPFTDYFYVTAGSPNHLFKGSFKLHIP
jgi:hypothetical protein